MTPPDNLALMREAADALSELLEVANRSEPGMDNVKRFVGARCSARTTLAKLRDATLCAGNTKAEAIAAWNTRAATSDNLDLIERAMADLSECPKWLQCVPSHEAGSTTDLLIDRINATLATLAKLRDATRSIVA